MAGGRIVIPNECEGSKKDFHPESILSLPKGSK